MFTTMSVQLPSHTLLELVSHLQRRPGTQDVSEAIATAVEFWLADQKQFPKTADPNGLRGYQWKCLFLPEGTVLRSWSYGEHNYACVEGDQIMHRGRSVSPNEFARAFARTNRNAWLDLKVRRPGDKQFRQAGLLRKEIMQERARKPAVQPADHATLLAAVAEVQQPSPPLPSLPSAPRDPTPGEGWTLPERRKFRFRLEDVAFE